MSPCPLQGLMFLEVITRNLKLAEQSGSRLLHETWPYMESQEDVWLSAQWPILIKMNWDWLKKVDFPWQSMNLSCLWLLNCMFHLFSSSDMSACSLRCHFSAWLKTCLSRRTLVCAVLINSDSTSPFTTAQRPVSISVISSKVYVSSTSLKTIFNFYFYWKRTPSSPKPFQQEQN